MKRSRKNVSVLTPEREVKKDEKKQKENGDRLLFDIDADILSKCIKKVVDHAIQRITLNGPLEPLKHGELLENRNCKKLNPTIKISKLHYISIRFKCKSYLDQRVVQHFSAY